MALSHGRSRYKRGCRCEACRMAERDYRRTWRARLRAAEVPDEQVEGDVCAGVRVELASIAESRPGLFALALSMALILDNAPTRLHPPASRVLTRILDRATGSTPKRSRLAHLRSIERNNP